VRDRSGRQGDSLGEPATGEAVRRVACGDLEDVATNKAIRSLRSVLTDRNAAERGPYKYYTSSVNHVIKTVPEFYNWKMPGDEPLTMSG